MDYFISLYHISKSSISYGDNWLHSNRWEHNFFLLSRGSVMLSCDRYNIVKDYILCASLLLLLLMVLWETLQALWYHLPLSSCTMLFEVKRQGMQESKQHHTPHCWLPAKVMYPAKSTKRFSFNFFFFLRTFKYIRWVYVTSCVHQ